MSEHCHCRDPQRRLAIYHAGPTEDVLELWAAADRLGWTRPAQGHVAEVELGPKCRFDTVAALSDFLHGVAPEAFPGLRAHWLSPSERGNSIDWNRAEPFEALAPLASSPLLWIIEHKTIETWFQPIRLASNQRLWGYECLMRAQDEHGHYITPEQAIAWARQEHLLFMLDRLCRELHVEHAAASGAPPWAHFFINFLPTVIYDPEVCLRSTVGAAQRVGLAPERIVFEVIETEKIPDRQHLRRILDFYRLRGFRVALDDLGAGHSDLVLLGDISPDLIKIERELITKSTTSSIHRSICRSIAEIGKEENKLVLAEGVETEAEWALVSEMQVDLVQGFLFGRPERLPSPS